MDVLEDPEDYQAFERAVTSDFDVQTAVAVIQLRSIAATVSRDRNYCGQ